MQFNFLHIANSKMHHPKTTMKNSFLFAMKSIKCNYLYASLLSIEMKEFKAKIEKNMKQK
jgi:hypothetical protein